MSSHGSGAFNVLPTRCMFPHHQEGGGSLAVRMAMGETNIVAENKAFLKEYGVNLSAFDTRTKGRSRTVSRGRSWRLSGDALYRVRVHQRSFPYQNYPPDQVILVKNLPRDVTEAVLRPMFEKYGSIARLVMPPSMTMALIEFLEPSEARYVCKRSWRAMCVL